jgi:hypothetical protein
MLSSRKFFIATVKRQVLTEYIHKSTRSPFRVTSIKHFNFYKEEKIIVEAYVYC